MTANESPAMSGASVKGLPDQFNQDNSTAAPTTSAEARRIEIPEAWDEYLFRMTGALGAGRLELWQLPKSLHWLWTCAWFAGRASRDDEVFRLTVENEVLHFRAYNPGKTAADFRRARTDALWAEGVAA